MTLRQHHRAHTARLECRVPVDLRAHLVALAAAEHRSLNMLTNLCLEEGLAARAERARLRRDQDPARARLLPEQPTMTQVKAELARISREFARGPAEPELPADLSPDERRKPGLPITDELEAEVLGDGPKDAGEQVDPRMAALLDQMEQMGLLPGQVTESRTR